MKKTIQLFVLAASMVLSAGALADVQATKQLDKASPKQSQTATPQRAQPAQATPSRMTRALKARDFDRLLAQQQKSNKPAAGGAGSFQAPNQGPQTYIIEDCGEGLVCCSYSGSGSTCNMFQYLCTSQGGQATGDSNEAVCSF